MIYYFDCILVLIYYVTQNCYYNMYVDMIRHVDIMYNSSI